MVLAPRAELRQHVRIPESEHMKRVFLLLVTVPAFAQMAEPHRVKDSVTDCVHVREDHYVTSSEIACLTAGTAIVVTDTAPYWREITFGSNQEGWIAKKFIEPTAPQPTAPDSGIPQDAFLEVHFVDVGQGDAIWIQTHDDGLDGNGRFEGHSIIIDGGPYSADDENPFREYVESIGHHNAVIEAMIVTHPHTDHYRGAETMSRHFDIQNYYDPGIPKDAVGYEAFLNAMRGTSISGAPPRAANIHIGPDILGNLDWGNELDAEIIYTWPGDNTGLGNGSTLENNASIVLRLAYGDHVFLFMGDAEGKDRDDDPDDVQYVEDILLAGDNSILDATVLKIAHHGSETSSTNQWISAVDPEIVVVQSGRKPFSGTFIPDSTTLQRYCDHNSNIRIYRTDQGDEAAGHLHKDAVDGDHIVIRTNGSGDPQVEALENGSPIIVGSCSP